MTNSNSIRRTVATLFIATFFSDAAYSQGLLPVPDIAGATVTTEAVAMPFGEFEYRYTIDMPASATGNVWLFEVDVSAEERTPRTGFERRYPIRDGAFRNSMRADADLLAPFFGEKGREVVIVNQFGPTGWNGGMTALWNTMVCR